MKKYLQILGITGIILSCFTATAASFEKPEDNSIVDIIKQYSNLTDRDVKKIKLVKLGMLQEPVAGTVGATAVAAGGYGAYKGHALAGTAVSKAGEYAQTWYKPDSVQGATPGFIKMYVPESLINLVSNKWAWAIAGAVGIGYGSYKFLYPRLEKSILNRIKIFIDMCENLDVYSFDYPRSPGGLPNMGTATHNQYGQQYKSEWLSVNLAWHTTNIARREGLKNLLEQAGVALNLLAQLIQQSPKSTELSALQKRVNTITDYLNNNRSIIDQFAQYEVVQRQQANAAQVDAQHRAAQVGLVQQQTSALRWGKFMGIINAVPYAVKKTAETLTYIFDNKEKIAGGVVAIYFLPQALRTAWWLQSLAAKDAAERLAAAQKAAAELAAQGK